VLECVINVSEGRDADALARLRDACSDALLDVHTDADHNRSVFTLAGWDVFDAARSLARCAVTTLDLRAHAGVHPRIGVVDVVPFVPLFEATLDDAIAARNRFAMWAAETLGVPCFLYGPERALPDVRRDAFTDALRPDVGPQTPHASAGAIAVGARPVLVAYNVWLAHGTTIDVARRIARDVRRPGVVRALGLPCRDRVQVSMNLLDWAAFGPADAYDAVAAHAPDAVAGGELVGLLPAAALDGIEATRWDELDVSPERTIEARLRETGLDGGRFAGG
jgi:glutamate formiminotransferase